MRGFQESMSGRLALSLEVRAERDLYLFRQACHSAWSSIHTMGASVLYRPAQLLLSIAPAAQPSTSSGTVTQASRCLCSPEEAGYRAVPLASTDHTTRAGTLLTI